MSIPWSVECRPDTRQYNARLGMWLFLAADAMFMGALFSSLVFLRTAGSEWTAAVEQLPMSRAFIGVILIEAAAISVTIAWKRSSLKALAAHLAVALAAIAVLTWDQATLAAAAENTAFAMAHVLNGVVRAHMIGAVLYALWMLLVNGRMRQDAPQRFRNRLECLGLFWHFTGLAWVISFILLYLL